MSHILLKNARVVDPVNDVDDKLDIALADGKVASVGEDLSSENPEMELDLSGKTVVPGIIDSHAHFSREGDRIGHRMMASVGVTTAIDFSASPEDLREGVKQKGAGLDVGCLFPLIPDDTISDSDPDRNELESVIEEAEKRGALGIKLIGGHRPITPDAFRKAVEIANERGIYVASHLGTTESASNLKGLRELPELIEDGQIHVAHVNSYCRGMINSPAEEANEAMEIIRKLGDRVVSESYLGTINGTGGECREGVPTSHVTRNCLSMEGYEETEEGLREAIMDGYCSVVVPRGSRRVLVSGKEGVRVWRDKGTEVNISFPVNSPEATFLLAVRKEHSEGFLIDAISTDGGSYPRNHIVDRGLALVRYGALSLDEFVLKSAVAPAEMFGLEGKGHLGEGADGDVTVLDPQKGEAVMGVSGGELVMLEGVPIGEGGTLLTTEEGESGMEASGFPTKEAKIKEGLLYSKHQKVA